MGPLTWLAALGGMLAALGVVGAVAAARGWQPRLPRPRRWRRGGQRALAELPPAWQRLYRPLLVVAGAVALVVWVVTGWPLHGVVAGGIVAGLPFVLHPGGSAQAHIARLDAVAVWLRQMAGVHIAGLSLEHTIQSSVAKAPAQLQAPLGQLAMRLRRGMPARRAYRMFAAEMADTTVDEVVMLLRAHTDARGPGLARALEAAAEGVEQQAKDAREVDAERAKTRASARRVSLLALVVAAVVTLNTGYGEVYASGLGQLGLLALGGMAVAALVWLRRKAQDRPKPRLWAPIGAREVEEGVQ